MYYRGGGFSLARVFASAVVRKLGYVLAAGAVALVATQCHAAQCFVESGGSLVLDAVPVADCTGYVLATSTEFQLMADPGIGALSLEEGAAIGLAIMVC